MMYFINRMLAFKGDYSPLVHASVLIIGVLSAWLLKFNMTYAFGAICFWFAFFFSREIAQAEKRPNDYPASAEGKWYRGLYFWMWNDSSKRDIVWPLISALILVVVAVIL